MYKLKVIDKMTSLYQDRIKTNSTAAEVRDLIDLLINTSSEYSPEDKLLLKNINRKLCNKFNRTHTEEEG